MIAILYIIFFSAVILFSPFFNLPHIPKKWIIPVFWIKILFGFILTWVYTNYYPDRSTADIFKYYDDAKIIHGALDKNPSEYFNMIFGWLDNIDYYNQNYFDNMNHWHRKYDFGSYNDNRTMIRFNAILMPLTAGSFNAHTVIMCFLSFSGLTALFKAFQQYFVNRNRLLFFIVYLIPSVLFWSSGVLKEGLLLLALGFLFHCSFSLFIHRRLKLSYLIGLIISVWLMMINKSYLLFIIFPLLTAFILSMRFKYNPIWNFILVLLFCGVIFEFSFSKLKSEKPIDWFVLKQRDFVNLSKGGLFLLNQQKMLRLEPGTAGFLIKEKNDSVKIPNGLQYMYWENLNFNDTLYAVSNGENEKFKLVWDLPRAGSLVNVVPLSNSYTSFFIQSPMAFFTAFVQPAVFSASSVLAFAASIENILLIVIFVFLLCFQKWNRNNLALLLLLTGSVILLFTLVGFTTPIAGAIMRYKVPFLPFLLMIPLVNANTERISKIPIIRFFVKS